MKIFKLSILVGFAAMIMCISGNAMAFHDGGVAKCEGCHTMHDSLKGAAMIVAGGPARAEFTGNSYLLQGSDASSTCLNCHGKGTTLSGYHVATGADKGYNGTYLPAQRTPGGDFSWLKVAFSAISTSAGKSMQAGFGAPKNVATNRHGHHIVAADYSYVASTDYTNNLGPGGIYRVGDLGCNSCHNPHSALRQTATGGATTAPISMSGSYGGTPDTGTSMGVYRLLGGNGYRTPNAVSGFSFNANPPAAVAPSTYNQSEATNEVAVSYGAGMSEWCANCHGNLLNNASDASSTHRHVASNSATNWTDPLGADLSVVYNNYVNTGNKLTAGAGTNVYSLAPFERGGTDPTVLITNASNTGGTLAGPTNGTSHVMCLSCHRAHASGFSSMARFDIDNGFITAPTGEIAFSNGAHEMAPDTSGYYAAAYYDRPNSAFGNSQRSWCNKCHGKD